MKIFHNLIMLFALIISFLVIVLTVTGESDGVLNSVTVIKDKDTDEKKYHILAGETPTIIPSLTPTNKPTVKATTFIYGNGVEPVQLSEKQQQIMCAVMTVMLFILMAMEVLSPEVLFMLALIVLMLTQVLTLSETLSGIITFSKYLHLKIIT